MKYLSLALIAAMSLSACGNKTDANLSVKVAKTISSSIFKRKKATKGLVKVTDEQVKTVLSEQPKPVFFGRIPDRGILSVLVKTSERSGFTTYFTSFVESITASEGLITATRGIGGDLMSSSAEASITLLQNRHQGNAKRIMRYIGKNEQTEEIHFDCVISRGSSYNYKFGEIATQVTEMREACETDGFDFTNSYLVDNSGFIVKSRQWISPNFAYIHTEFLRK